MAVHWQTQKGVDCYGFKFFVLIPLTFLISMPLEPGVDLDLLTNRSRQSGAVLVLGKNLKKARWQLPECLDG